MKETELYPAVKSFFQQLGYEVKAEIKSCDAVAIAGDDLIIIELKKELNLTALLQGVDRYSLSDDVYIAVPHDLAIIKKKRKHVIKLMRLLGLGLLTVEPGARVGAINILCEPGAYQSKRRTRRRKGIFEEFSQRQGDPNMGGHAMRDGSIITAYRQKAQAIAEVLSERGVMTPKELREILAEPKVQQILASNHYGWFERVSRGKYRLCELGYEKLKLEKCDED